MTTGTTTAINGDSSIPFLCHTAMSLTLIQAGVFCYYIDWGEHIVPPPFLLYLLSNYHETWHDSFLRQSLSKAVKVRCIMMSL